MNEFVSNVFEVGKLPLVRLHHNIHLPGSSPDSLLECFPNLRPVRVRLDELREFARRRARQDAHLPKRHDRPRVVASTLKSLVKTPDEFRNFADRLLSERGGVADKVHTLRARESVPAEHFEKPVRFPNVSKLERSLERPFAEPFKSFGSFGGRALKKRHLSRPYFGLRVHVDKFFE